MRRTWAGALLVLICASTAGLYLARLADSPPYLSIEEVGATRQAMSLATTGRSLSGQRLPLYVAEPGYEAGRDPLWIYMAAALLKVRPFSETLIRTPSALVGVLDVMLMFVLARLAFDSAAWAFAAAVLLALSPAHFFESRIATQQIGPVAFTLGWLILLTRFLESGRARDVFFACFVLGVGIYSYLGAFVTTPFYFLATLVVIVTRSGPVTFFAGLREARRPLLYACLGIALAMVPYFAWNAAHPERIRQLLSYYTDNGYNPDVRAEHFSVAQALVARADLWWNAFNPERLFFVGDSNYRLSTRHVGYFLWPTAPFLAVGLLRLRRYLSQPLSFVCYVALLFGVVPAVLAGDLEIKRWLSIVVFIVLVAVCGARAMWDTRRWSVRLAAVALACLGALQFGAFMRDYHGDYRARSSSWFGGNLRGAIRTVLASAHDPACVFLDNRIAIAAYWAMYTRAYNQSAFADSAHLVDSERPDFAPPSSCRDATLVVIAKEVANHAEYRNRLATQGWRGTPIPEPDGRIALTVFRWSAQDAAR
jgi:hypothetical protein